ncbi:MAG TPA: HAMP domain-containing sensor histidine kinase [Candidatus Paceibacterota bacterium]
MALVTKWVRDEFVIAWTKLIAIYILTSGFFLSILSYVIYIAIRGNLISVIGGLYNPFTEELILNQALSALKERILLADFFVMIIVVVVAIFITARTLNPIRRNMQKQKRFIADASHELRTPLAILKLDIEVLLREKKFNEEQTRDSLKSLVGEVDSIINLTNSLLSLSRTKLHADREQIKAEQLLKSVVDNFQTLAHEKGLMLTFTSTAPQATIRAHRADLERIYTNVLKNAYQYTPAGGMITVDLSKKGNSIIVTIQDTGIGIHADNLERVFEPFYQEKTSRTGEGSGLGLSLVKKLLEEYHGTIELESEQGKGTKVTITL